MFNKSWINPLTVLEFFNNVQTDFYVAIYAKPFKYKSLYLLHKTWQILPKNKLVSNAFAKSKLCRCRKRNTTLGTEPNRGEIYNRTLQHNISICLQATSFISLPLREYHLFATRPFALRPAHTRRNNADSTRLYVQNKKQTLEVLLILQIADVLFALYRF